MAGSMEMDRAGAIRAGGATLLGFWFEETLGECLPLSEDHSADQRELRIAAAREAVVQLAPEEAGLRLGLCRAVSRVWRALLAMAAAVTPTVIDKDLWC